MPNNNCQLHNTNNNALGYSTNSHGEYSTFAPLCSCIREGCFDRFGWSGSKVTIWEDVYNAIAAAEAWEWLKNKIDRHFLGTDDPVANKIVRRIITYGKSKFVNEFVFNDAFIDMDLIAKNGWDWYVASRMR